MYSGITGNTYYNNKNGDVTNRTHNTLVLAKPSPLPKYGSKPLLMSYLNTTLEVLDNITCLIINFPTKIQPAAPWPQQNGHHGPNWLQRFHQPIWGTGTTNRNRDFGTREYSMDRCNGNDLPGLQGRKISFLHDLLLQTKSWKLQQKTAVIRKRPKYVKPTSKYNQFASETSSNQHYANQTSDYPNKRGQMSILPSTSGNPARKVGPKRQGLSRMHTIQTLNQAFLSTEEN